MAELRPYNPTIRDRIASALMGEARPGSARANMVEGMMGSRGIGTTGMGLADLTPAGVPMAAQEAVRQGDYRGAAIAVVPPLAASKMGFAANAGKNSIIREAIQNTPAASLDGDVLRMNISRYQSPSQAMEMSTRGGVFYLPENSPYSKYYNTTTKSGTMNNYGGADKVAGETAIYNPLVVKGQTGGKVPEEAFKQLMGKKELEALQKDVFGAAFAPKNHGIQEMEVQRFLENRAPEMANEYWNILQNSTKGNQLKYALQEAAIGSAARNAGYDSILGYSMTRGAEKKPFLTELFDIRENRYPSKSGDYNTWPIMGGIFNLK